MILGASRRHVRSIAVVCFAALAALLVLPSAFVATLGSVNVRLLEDGTHKTTAYTFDPRDGTVQRVENASGSVLRPSGGYSVHGGKLYSREDVLADADEILCQAKVGDFDIIVVRDEYNSFSNPWRVLMACSGHPVQVSKIVALSIQDGRVRAKSELTRKASSYHWKASLWQ